MKKLTSDLQPGDILPAGDGLPRRVIQYFTAGSTPTAARGVHTVPLGAPLPPSCTLLSPPQEFVGEGYEVDVDVPAGCVGGADLAMLVDAARQLIGIHDSGDAGPNLMPAMQRGILRELVDRIDPPNPPTLVEALTALAKLDEGARAVQAGEWDKDSMQVERSVARALLLRARRAGVLA